MSDVLVLCYHAVSERWPSDLAVSPRQLEEQLAWLVASGYRGTTFRDAVDAPPAGKTLVVTFDDAFRSVYEGAAPVLARFGLPGTVFVPVDHVGGDPMEWPGIEQWLGGEYERELLGMTWPELEELSDRGWEIGSHTCTHPYLTRLDDAALHEELQRSREHCEERLGRACVTLAYPYGDTDERVEHAAAEAGYRAAAALSLRLDATPRPFAWPRVGIYPGDGRLAFRAKVSATVRRLRASRAATAFAAASGVAKRVTSATR